MSDKQKTQTFSELLAICLQKECDPEKQDLLNILFAFKQILAVVIGIIAGVNGLTGIITIVGFFVANFAITYFYSFKFLQIDQEKIEQNQLYTQALMLSFFEFLLTWILVYTFW